MLRRSILLVVALFAAGLLPPRADPARQPFAAHAQGVSFCFGCSCGTAAEQAACEARQRAEFERANPPRGTVTGVCFADQYRWVTDPATRNQVPESRNPIFSRVRFNETEVLSSSHHGRDAGFGIDVGREWTAFVGKNHPLDETARRDGWSWRNSCAVLSNPRYDEDKGWERAQASATYRRVFMPTYGVADTPEERKLEAKAAAEAKAKEAERARAAAQQKREADARAAEVQRQREAAEAARRAEAARVEAERQRKVDAIANQLGPGKREAAERLQRMNDELAALRPQPRPQPPAKPRQCTSRSFSQVMTNSGPTRDRASQYLTTAIARKGGANIGGMESVVSMTGGGAPVCTQRTLPQMKPPPVGKCLACITEGQAAEFYGWVKGKGYPPPPTDWQCKITVQVVAEKCGDGQGSKVRQE